MTCMAPRIISLENHMKKSPVWGPRKVYWSMRVRSVRKIQKHTPTPAVNKYILFSKLLGFQSSKVWVIGSQDNNFHI